MVAVTYGIRPYGGHADRLGEPAGDRAAGRGRSICLVAFVFVERRVAEPDVRAAAVPDPRVHFGTLSTFLSAVARGGLMFMLIIWLQGIWLPQHGYDFTETPLWAGIYMLPLTLGMLFAGPDLGLSVRPLRRAPVRDRRDGRRGAQLRPADAAADRFRRIRCSPRSWC